MVVVVVGTHSLVIHIPKSLCFLVANPPKLYRPNNGVIHPYPCRSSSSAAPGCLSSLFFTAFCSFVYLGNKHMGFECMHRHYCVVGGISNLMGGRLPRLVQIPPFTGDKNPDGDGHVKIGRCSAF